MTELNKKSLSGRDVCTKYIMPAIQAAGWNTHLQMCEEVSFTAAWILVRGKEVKQARSNRADYIVYSADEVKGGGYNLDIKNPHDVDIDPGDADQLLTELERIRREQERTLARLKQELSAALGGKETAS